MSQGRETISKPAEAVAANIEAILRLEDAAMRQRTWADILADGTASFTGTIWFVAIHPAWFGAWAAVNARLVHPSS